MKRHSISRLREAYDAQQSALVRWLAALPADVWERSALGEWSVRELALHTTEVPGALTRTLANGPVRERPMSIAAYTSIWREAAPEIAAREKAGAAGLSLTDVLARHEIEQAAFHNALDQVDGDP